MDGQRVGVVLNAPGQACDQIHYWNIPWHYFARINMPDDLTCSRHMSIRSLSLGGLTSEWVAVRNHVARVVRLQADVAYLGPLDIPLRLVPLLALRQAL